MGVCGKAQEQAFTEPLEHKLDERTPFLPIRPRMPYTPARKGYLTRIGSCRPPTGRQTGDWRPLDSGHT